MTKNLLAVFGFVVLFGIVAGTCVACDDEDENGFRPELELVSHHRDGDESSNNENGRDCYQAQAECSDDDKIDFRPVVCLPESHCDFAPESFFPIPNPLKFGEYLGNGFKLGTNFARVLADAIITFVADLGVFIA